MASLPPALFLALGPIVPGLDLTVQLTQLTQGQESI